MGTDQVSISIFLGVISNSVLFSILTASFYRKRNKLFMTFLLRHEFSFIFNFNALLGFKDYD